MALIKLNDRAVKDATEFGSITSLGEMKFISKATASSSASIEFTSGIDSTYKEYVFYFVNIHPSADSAEFGFQADTGTNTNYNQTITSTFFKAQHRQDDVVSGLAYDTGQDLAQSTSFQRLGFNIDASQASDNFSGYLHIFNPSSDTFVKHFISTNNYTYDGDGNEQYSFNTFVAGYFNTTTALTRFQFSGEIILFGIN
jgi:hypothetical protein